MGNVLFTIAQAAAATCVVAMMAFVGLMGITLIGGIFRVFPTTDAQSFLIRTVVAMGVGATLLAWWQQALSSKYLLKHEPQL